MSIPRPATSVATRISFEPFLRLLRANSRCSCPFPPCRETGLYCRQRQGNRVVLGTETGERVVLRTETGEKGCTADIDRETGLYWGQRQGKGLYCGHRQGNSVVLGIETGKQGCTGDRDRGKGCTADRDRGKGCTADRDRETGLYWGHRQGNRVVVGTKTGKQGCTADRDRKTGLYCGQKQGCTWKRCRETGTERWKQDCTGDRDKETGLYLGQRHLSILTIQTEFGFIGKTCFQTRTHPNLLEGFGENVCTLLLVDEYDDRGIEPLLQYIQQLLPKINKKFKY